MGNSLAYVSFPTFFDSGLMVTRQPVIYEVAAGKNHTCVSAETSTGKDQLYCWGKNTNGELSTGVDGNGNQDYANKISPTITSIQTSQIFSLKSGGDHTCMYYNDTVSTKFY
jgi:alpha-tubulin suppressor-like RCC1 family protein